MKSFIGLAQIGLGIWGIVALFNGHWLIMIGAWAGGMLLGLLGNRMVNGAEGVSESGRVAIQSTPRALELLRRSEFGTALGLTGSIVRDLRLGGDKALLAFVLPLHAVSLGANGDVSAAHRALRESQDLLRFASPELSESVSETRQVCAVIRSELQRGVADPQELVRTFLVFNDS